MNYQTPIRFVAKAAIVLSATGALAFTVAAQDKPEKKDAKPVVASEKSSGRDPFKRYQPVIKIPKSQVTKLEAPTIEQRIARYRAQKAAAANAHVAAPKPTTALLLNELQVTGIFRTPRGWAAMVEAMPIKLSYVIYPGENFFDGQLVAIEESRLVFRREVVWNDGRKESVVDVKPLRQPSPIEGMTASKSSAAETAASEVAKPATPEKQ
jgi:hypothetical protein